MNFKETLKFLPAIHKTKLCPVLLGHTGIGKTELADAYAASLEYHLIVIHVAQLEPSDFIGLYQIVDGLTTNRPPSWLPNEKFEVVGSGNKPKGYVILLDEINRGHEDIRQAMYQFLTTKCIHTYKAPENTLLIATANPASHYECYEFDDALNNRLAHIPFRPVVDETINYLEGKHGRNMILTWANTDKGLIDMGADDFEIPVLKFAPRVLENAIVLFREIENESPAFQRKCLETIMPKDKTASFLAFLDEVKHINYIDVMNGVKAEKVKELLKNNRIDILSTIVTDIGKLMESYEIGSTELKDEVKGLKVSEKEAIVNMAVFLQTCPSELATLFLNLLGDTFEKKTCILNDPNFAKPLTEKLKGFKDVLVASKKSKK